MTSPLTYQAALAYLGQFINYERRPRFTYNTEHFNLQAFTDFLHTLGDPHEQFPTVLIAGSKGKGSTAAMIAAVLSQAGLRTGLFSKPHLVTIRERTQIDRQLISPADFAALVTELQGYVGTPESPYSKRFRTFFELTTALCFLYFARHHVDIAVVEVGLGGRLDTTNVLTPRVAVLTPIGLEHTQILGDTLAAIAGEKAGIIKPHACVVSAPQEPEAAAVFVQRCQEQAATLLLAQRDFSWEVSEHSVDGMRVDVMSQGQRLENLTIPLLGRHQAANAAVAVTVLQQLQQQGWAISEAHIRQGLATVQWEGRMEILQRHPWIVLDAAHTVESAQCLCQALQELFPGKRCILVLGMAVDKKSEEIIATLAPLAAEVIVTRSSHPKAYEPQLLAAAVRQHGVPVQLAADPLTALTMARASAQDDALICVTGSVLLLGELKARLQGIEPEF